MSAPIDALFANNRAWAGRAVAGDPTFFERLVAQQSPRYLWIGCSDSRVPANEIVGLRPGELFVHRNVANVVVHTDLNCLSVLQFAIDVLQVEHVIVCGHYGCGGIQAAHRRQPLGLIDNWLRHVQDVADRHREAFRPGQTESAQVDLLCELNVIEQVVHVCRTTIVQDAWRRGQAVAIHGWVYHLTNGLLNDMGLTVASPADLESGHPAAVRRLVTRPR